MTKLDIGKYYKYVNTKAFPESMNGAKVTITGFGSDKQSATYDFEKIDGGTGNGSIAIDHAETHFEPLNL